MGINLNELNRTNSLADGDLILVYSNANGSSRSASVNTLKTYIGNTETSSGRVQDVTYSSNMNLDLDNYDAFNITLAGNATITFSGGTNLQKVLLCVTQDGTGGRTITWGGTVAFGTDLSGITLSSAGGDIDLIGFINKPSSSKVLAVSLSRGF